MPIIKKTEPMPERPVIILIYGEPGTGKTSLFNTCANPLLLDFDRGVDRSHGRIDTLHITSGYKEILQEDAAGSFEGYATIGIDTPKAFLDDFLMMYVIEQDYKLRTNKLKAYGAIADEFKIFINKRRDAGIDIFMVVHSVTDKDGDIVKMAPDVTGGSLQLLKRISDQVGYMHMDPKGNRVIDFAPSNSIVGKDVAGLGTITLPDVNSPDYANFADREIVQKVKGALQKMSADQVYALEQVSTWQTKIDAVEGSDNALKQISADLNGIAEEHIKKQAKAYLTKHLKTIGWKWDKDAKVFITIPTE